MDAVKFRLGELVYAVVYPETAGMVTGIVFRPHGVAYYVTYADGNERTHYDIELTREKSFVSGDGNMEADR